MKKIFFLLSLFFIANTSCLAQIKNAKIEVVAVSGNCAKCKAKIEEA